ncbi:methionyl-tRNA formyltransferase [bacterium]|nr:methionyl-tRNA formyltransferase [bacterium]
MKVAFFGTPDFAVITLERLLASSHEVVAVVTQPDKPAGRGRKLTPPPVKVLAEQSGLPVHQPKSVRGEEFRRQLADLSVDVAVVVAYGKILPKELLEVPRHGFLNVHASLLPKYRGAAPIQWALVNGEETTGVSIMQIDEGLDTGPVLARHSVDILEDDDARSMMETLSVYGADLMITVLDMIEEHGHAHAEAQDDSKATMAPLIHREDAHIDWSKPAESIIWMVRGFQLWPGAHTTFNKGQALKITGMEAVDPTWVSTDWQDKAVPEGTVVETLRNRGFVVKTGHGGLVLVTRAQPAGKKEMDAHALVNGGVIDVGTQFV